MLFRTSNPYYFDAVDSLWARDDVGFALARYDPVTSTVGDLWAIVERLFVAHWKIVAPLLWEAQYGPISPGTNWENVSPVDLITKWAQGVDQLLGERFVRPTLYHNMRHRVYRLWHDWLDDTYSIDVARERLRIVPPPSPTDVWGEWIVAAPAEHPSLFDLITDILTE